MTPCRPTARGVVCLASLDVRRRPDHRSEMGSQLLMGEVVRVVRRGGGGLWRLVENGADGYRGWVRAWGLLETGARGAAAWRRRARARAVTALAEVRERPGRGALVSPLFWGGRLIPGPARGRHRQVELPDGRQGWVAARAVRLRSQPVPALSRRVRDLLGVPYLWGGRTPAGLDCSGFVQLLLAERGYRMPRNSGDQERVCRPLTRHERPRPGDLTFFGRPRQAASHVAVLLGGGDYAHARGRVKVNSLEPSSPLFDNDLYRQFRGIRRPVRRLRERL